MTAVKSPIATINQVDGEEFKMSEYSSIKISEIEKELVANKQLIEMTKGDEDGEDSACSDSEPSEDNLSEEEMAKIIPIKRKEVAVKPKEEAKNKKMPGRR